MDPLTIGVIGMAGLIVLVVLGMRVVFAAAIVGMVGLVSMLGWDAGTGIAGTIPHSKSVAYTLSVLPMFILIGYLAFHAGLTTALFDAAQASLLMTVGHSLVPGFRFEVYQVATSCTR